MAYAPAREKTENSAMRQKIIRSPGIGTSSVHRANCLSHHFYLDGYQRCLNPNVPVESDCLGKISAALISKLL